MVQYGAAATKDEAPLHVLTCKGLQHTPPGENLKLQMKYTGQTHTNNTPLRLYTGFYICMKTYRKGSGRIEPISVGVWKCLGMFSYSQGIGI